MTATSAMADGSDATGGSGVLAGDPAAGDATAGDAGLGDTVSDAEREDVVLTEARQSAEQRFRSMGPPGREAGWWGVVIGFGAVATVLAALVYAYVYLMISAPSSWPPESAGLPDLGLSSLALVLLGLAVLGHVGWWRDGRLALAGAALGLGAGAGFLVVQGAALAASGLAIDEDAYAAVFTTIQVAGLVVVGAGLPVSALALWVGARSPGRAPMRVAVTYWWLASGAWLSLWVVLHLVPRVAG